MLFEPTSKNISKRIPPNYSSWQTIELSYQCAKYAIDNNVPGVFVECGVAAGNNLAAMCKAGRWGYGFDSFEGIPWAGPNDDQQPGFIAKFPEKEGILESSGVSSHDIEGVMQNMDRWGIKNYTLSKGWFQKTLIYWPSGIKIAVLRLDGDLYDSTIIPLRLLYPHLSKGGILIMDDWNLGGCRRAFEDYFHDEEKPTLIFDNGITYWMR